MVCVAISAEAPGMTTRGCEGRIGGIVLGWTECCTYTAEAGRPAYAFPHCRDLSQPAGPSTLLPYFINSPWPRANTCFTRLGSV